MWQEAVAATPDGFDQAVMARGLQGQAQSPDMDIDRALFDEDMITPDTIEKLAARQHTVKILHEVMQQSELGWAHFDRRAFGNDPEGVGLKAQAGDLDRVVGSLRCTPAQQRTDSGNQFAW